MKIATILFLAAMLLGCSTPKAVLPQVGSRAIPDILLPERPVFTPLTESEFDAIPIQAKGKILKFITDTTAFCDIADAAIQEYRFYIQSLFDGDSIPKAVPETRE